MPFEQMKLYMARFRLPDGEHIAAGHSSENIKIAREHFARIIRMNPEAQFDPEKDLTPTTAEEVQAATAALREQDPSRPLATDMGFDTPNRILSDPHLVPGSQIMPPGSGPTPTGLNL